MIGVLVESARFAMGVMAPTPIRLYQTEAYLTKKTLTPDVTKTAIEIMCSEVHPRTSHHASKEYRILLAQNLLGRFLSGQAINP